MSLSVTCSACHHQFAVPNEYAGKKGKCPKCHAIIVAPAAEAPSAPAAKAPPARIKTAAPLEAVPAAPAPARPAPRPSNAVQTSNTVRPTDTVTGAAPSFNFDTGPAGAASTVTKRAAKPKPAANNTGLFIGLGIGGGILALGLVLAVVMGLGGGGDDPAKKPIADASGSTKKDTTNKGSNKKKGGKKEEEDTGSLLDRPAPKERPKPEQVNITAAKPHQAKSLEEIKLGVVKILSPGINGTSQGTGFIINEKGWIATNCHVIDDATDQTKVMINKQPYKVAGLVIKAAEHDMAIIKLAEQPFQLTTLDISFSEHPKFGSEVWAIGFPSDTFNLTKGIVSNVCTMSEMDSRGSQAFLRHSKSDPSHLWIQHNAKISPGNSGGPLLNENNQVIGINTWVSMDIETGYAGHINHLRDLIAKATDTVTPFPKGLSMEIAENDEIYNIVPTAERVNQLMAYCGKFSWKPNTKDEFEGMAELARLITIMQMAPPGADAKMADVKKATEAACQTLKGIAWDADHVAKINKFAQEATGQPLHGVFFFATITEPLATLTEKVKADKLTLEGVSQTVICRTKDGKSLGAKDARMLVIGMNMGVIQGEGMEPQRVIMPGHTISLKK